MIFLLMGSFTDTIQTFPAHHLLCPAGTVLSMVQGTRLKLYKQNKNLYTDALTENNTGGRGSVRMR